jgi:hypothetical protein
VVRLNPSLNTHTDGGAEISWTTVVFDDEDKVAGLCSSGG